MQYAQFAAFAFALASAGMTAADFLNPTAASSIVLGERFQVKTNTAVPAGYAATSLFEVELLSGGAKVASVGSLEYSSLLSGANIVIPNDRAAGPYSLKVVGPGNITDTSAEFQTTKLFDSPVAETYFKPLSQVQLKAQIPTPSGHTDDSLVDVQLLTIDRPSVSMGKFKLGDIKAGVNVVVPSAVVAGEARFRLELPLVCQTEGGCPNAAPYSYLSPIFFVNVDTPERCSLYCYKGRCYRIVPATNRAQGVARCGEWGGNLVDIRSADEFTWLANNFLTNMKVGQAWAASWNGDDYGSLDMYLSRGNPGALTQFASGVSPDVSNGICVFKPEREFSECADCKDQCFKDKCYRLVYAEGEGKKPFENVFEARKACPAIGGEVTMPDNAAEFYWISAFLEIKLFNVWIAGWQGDRYDNVPLQFTANGIDAAAITVPPNGANEKLPVLCQFKRSPSDNQCQNKQEQDVSNSTIEIVMERAERGVPLSRVRSTSSGASSLAVASVTAFLAAIIASIVM